MMPSSSSSQHQHAAARHMPPAATSLLVGLCCLLHACLSAASASGLVGFGLRALTLHPRSIVYLGERYRLVTAPLFHVDLFHVAMNTMSLAAIGSALERQIGTFQFLASALWAVLLTSSLHVLAAVAAWLLLARDDLMHGHSAGFSGVLFHMLVLECGISAAAGGSRRSVFGLVAVPSWTYPWVLLFALQAFLPNLSFMGHLAGIVSGTLHLRGCLDRILIPDGRYLRLLEEQQQQTGRCSCSCCVRRVVALPNFVATPSTNPLALSSSSPHSSTRGDLASARQAIRRGLGAVSSFACHLLEAIKVAVFGRGEEINDNIQLLGGRLGGSTTLSSRGRSRLLALDSDSDNDEDWNGLPPRANSESAMV